MRIRLVTISLLFGCLTNTGDLFGQENPADTKAPSDTTTSASDTTDVPYWGTLDAVVVTASRSEQKLSDVPSAMTVLDAKKIEALPADNYGDLLRLVPGVNSAEFSAGDHSIVARQATRVISSGQLAMIDNRTVYQNFNGQVWWNGLPLDPNEIKQIEVLRGPNSAVWGTNAMGGVINIITKSPGEMQGTTLMLGGGERGTAYGSLTYAGATGKFGYKASGSWFEQDAYDRPTGSIPGTEGPLNPGGTPYPPYDSQGTQQPKINARVDFSPDEKTTWSLSGGYGGMKGLILTPAGPATHEAGAFQAYVKADWIRQNTRISAYANFLDDDGRFLLSGVSGTNKSQTYHLDFTDTRIAGDKHFLTYGASARNGQFDSFIARNEEPRNELGAYLQDEIHFSGKVRWLLGVRVDHIERMGTAVSPRTSLMFSPVSGNSFRVSYNRAFRSPTMLENYLYVPAVSIITVPGPTGPIDLTFPFVSVGDADLNEERLEAFEVGWVGRFGRVEASVTAYRNELKDVIRQLPTEFWSSANPPPDWPLPDSLLDVPPPDGFAGVPSKLEFLNIGQLNDQGVEAEVSVLIFGPWTVVANYSWQDAPDTEGIDPVTHPSGTLVLPINLAPTHRFNGGVFWDNTRFYANANVNFQGEAYWTDVLDSRFWGPTESFAMVNVAMGARFRRQQVTVSVNAQNIFNEHVQQHVWGDIISRRVTAQVTYRF